MVVEYIRGRGLGMREDNCRSPPCEVSDARAYIPSAPGLGRALSERITDWGMYPSCPTPRTN